MNSFKIVTSPTIENENISSGNTKIFDDLDVLFPCFLVLEKDILWLIILLQSTICFRLTI
jgi:hypothetical protein